MNCVIGNNIYNFAVRKQRRKDHADKVVFSYAKNSQEWRYRKVSTHLCGTQFLATHQRKQRGQS
jgi:hypothetical protein